MLFLRHLWTGNYEIIVNGISVGKVYKGLEDVFSSEINHLAGIPDYWAEMDAKARSNE